MWSLHPRYLDRQGLIACWRESLLAQAVIAEPGRGYSRHPQLERFRQADDPLAAVGDYLDVLADEADARGYRFDRTKIRTRGSRHAFSVSEGQLAYEWRHLVAKLEQRSPEVRERWRATVIPAPHPIFEVVEGDVAEWEKLGADAVAE